MSSSAKTYPPSQPRPPLNHDLETNFLARAYSPSLPPWCTDDSLLTSHLEPPAVEERQVIRSRVMSFAVCASAGLRVDWLLPKWKTLGKQQQLQLILHQFSAAAYHTKHRPHGRLDTPKLTLAVLLSDDGQGFVDLADSLVYPRIEEAVNGSFPILPCGPRERLMGMSTGAGLVQSRARRAYIEDGLLRRHQTLHRFIAGIFFTLARLTFSRKSIKRLIARGSTNPSVAKPLPTSSSRSFPITSTARPLALLRRRCWIDKAPLNDVFWQIDVFGTPRSLCPSAALDGPDAPLISQKMRATVYDAIDNWSTPGISLGVLALVDIETLRFAMRDAEEELEKDEEEWRDTRGFLRRRGREIAKSARGLDVSEARRYAAGNMANDDERRKQVLGKEEYDRLHPSKS
ncbi:hypothetical protein JCM11641_003640 [Rhodosporidiobolus odoratus]